MGITVGDRVPIAWRGPSVVDTDAREVKLDPARHVFALGPFRVLREGFDEEKGCHARGYHNDVLFAEDPAGKPVVLKLTKNPYGLAEAALFDEVAHEADALRVLGKSSRIPDFQGVGQIADGRFVLAMSRAQGRSLKSVATDGTRDVVRLIDQVAAATESVHKRGFLHGDLHAGNIISERGDDGGYRVQIIDVGTAVKLAADGVYRGPRLGGDFIASSPEQMPDANNHVELTVKSDIYFLGVLLASRLTGQNPFKPDMPRDDWDAFLQASVMLRKRADVVPDVPDGPLKDVLRRALAFDPKDRFASVGAFRSALADALARDPLCTQNARTKVRADGIVVDRVGLARVPGDPWGHAFVAPDGVRVKLGFANVYPVCASALGPPLEDEHPTADGAEQRFAHGTLRWEQATNRYSLVLHDASHAGP